MALNDRNCPGCGAPVYRSHRCQGTARNNLTLEERRELARVNAASIRAQLAAPPATAPAIEVERLPLYLEFDEKD